MEHSDSQGSNDTIKITPQFAPHLKPKVNLLCPCDCTMEIFVYNNDKSNRHIWSYKWIFCGCFQGDPLRTLPLSRGGSVESLPARTQCLASSDSKRMSADLSELEPKMPFAPAGNARHYTAPKNTWEQMRQSGILLWFLLLLSTPFMLEWGLLKSTRSTWYLWSRASQGQPSAKHLLSCRGSDRKLSCSNQMSGPPRTELLCFQASM